DGITSSMRQPFVEPTSMNSMNRTMRPLPRKWRAISTTWWSFTPRFTTMFTLTGASPAASAASMPSRTRATGKSTSFIARKVSSSSESRLTVTRLRPASLSAWALRGSGEQLDQALEIAAHERLAAGDADLLDPVPDEHARESFDLLERQQLAPLEEL